MEHVWQNANASVPYLGSSCLPEASLASLGCPEGQAPYQGGEELQGSRGRALGVLSGHCTMAGSILNPPAASTPHSQSGAWP